MALRIPDPTPDEREHLHARGFTDAEIDETVRIVRARERDQGSVALPPALVELGEDDEQ